jgi:hypothetical protein
MAARHPLINGLCFSRRVRRETRRSELKTAKASLWRVRQCEKLCPEASLS